MERTVNDLIKSKRTRLRLASLTGLYFAALTLLATLLKLETVAVAAISGMMTILSAYLWAETKRPSKTDD